MKETPTWLRIFRRLYTQLGVGTLTSILVFAGLTSREQVFVMAIYIYIGYAIQTICDLSYKKDPLEPLKADPLIKKTFIFIIAMMAGASAIAQNVKPIIRPDTVVAYTGPEVTTFNVLRNDFDANGDRIRVTSVKFGTGYQAPGKVIAINGIGLVSIDSFGNGVFNCVATDTGTYTGLGYVANDGKMLSGISAKIYIKILKKPVIITEEQDTFNTNYGLRIWRDRYGLNIWQGNFRTSCELKVMEICPGQTVYYLMCWDADATMYQIPEEIGKKLMR